VPFALALPLVPLWASAATGQLAPRLWWGLPVGGVLGFALQLANQAPDVEAGERSGLPGVLGAAASRRVAALSFAGGTALGALILVADGMLLGGAIVAVTGILGLLIAPRASRMNRNGLFFIFAIGTAISALAFFG
jgi:hypothetical protein